MPKNIWLNSIHKVNYHWRVCLLGLILAAPGLCAQESATPEPILPEAFQWGGPPDNPGVRGAWVVGSESAAGLYALRVRLQQGSRIPPHTHPDARYTTVLDGTLYVGFGAEQDDSRLVAVPAGGLYVAPAGVPHYVLARDGNVVYQESGVGPSGMIWLTPQ